MRKNTAATNVISDMTLKINAWRMNGMVRRILKNSIASSLPGRVADGEPRHAAAMAIGEIHDRARDQHRREHRGHDAQTMHHGEAAHRARHHEQRKPDD